MYGTHISGVSPEQLLRGQGSLQADALLTSLGWSSQGKPLARSLYDARLLAPVSDWIGGLGGNPPCCGKQWCSIGTRSAEPRWTGARGLLKGLCIQSDISQLRCIISLWLLQGVVNLDFFQETAGCTSLYCLAHRSAWRIVYDVAVADHCNWGSSKSMQSTQSFSSHPASQVSQNSVLQQWLQGPFDL